MKLINAFVLACVGLTGTAAVADTATAPARKDKMICRVEGETGTRFKHRICATAQEWTARDEIAKEARANIDKVQKTRVLEGN